MASWRWRPGLRRSLGTIEVDSCIAIGMIVINIGHGRWWLMVAEPSTNSNNHRLYKGKILIN